MTPGFSIVITRDGTRLFEQATGQGKFELFAKNDLEFYLTVVDAQITFQVKNDEIESLTLFQNGQEMVGRRIE